MKIIKHIFFGLFLLVISSELIQNHFHIINEKPLSGVFVFDSKPTFSMDNWLSGKYQDSLIKYYEQDLDLHPAFIRLHNELGYLCFHEPHENDLEIGKKDILFGQGYTKSLLGLDFIGEDVIKEKVTKLAFVQAELEKRNVSLLFVITPTKSCYHKEELPEKYDLSKATRTNYDFYVKQFEKQKINFIDYGKLFLKLKSKTKYPLFTRCGIHWSGYGGTVAADTLIKYLEEQKNIDLTDYYYNGGELSNKPRGTDDDLGKAMNLMDSIPSFEMYYPNLVIKTDSTKVKPNILIVGDSYAWTWIYFYKFIPELFGDHSSFWFYNHELSWSKTPFELKFPLDKRSLSEQTLKQDYILLIYNQSALANCGSGFIEQMYDMLNEDSSMNVK